MHLERKTTLSSQKQKSIVQMFAKQSAFENKIKWAEIKLAGYLTAHDEAFLKMDHLVQVLKNIFPDS